MNELTERWEKTGLLDQMDSDFLKNECAHSLEETLQITTQELDGICQEVDKIYDNQGFFLGTILPLIRRIYSEYPERAPSMNVRWVVEDFAEYFKQNVAFYKKLEEQGIDALAKIIGLYIHNLQNNF